MSPQVTLLVYSLLIAAVSLAGGAMPRFWQWSHRGIQGVMSFVGGFMLAVGILHLLPHSLAFTGSTNQTMLAALAGVLTVFLLIRVFHIHQHPHAHDDLEDASAEKLTSWHDHAHHQGHAHDGHDGQDGHRRARVRWVGLFIGLSIHTVLDGVALGASVPLDGATDSPLTGLGTFLSVFLHKPLDALSITSLMMASGWSAGWQKSINWTIALLCPLSAFAFQYGATSFPYGPSVAVGIALGFSAGVFLCIALADILPEIQFHAHDRFLLSLLLLAGVAAALLVGLAEPAHLHELAPSAGHHH